MNKILVAVTFSAVSVSQLATDQQFSHILISGTDGAGATFEASIDGTTTTSKEFDVNPGALTGTISSIDTTGAVIDGSTLPFSFSVQAATGGDTFPVASNVNITQTA